MHPPTPTGISPRLSLWLRARRCAVPPYMIELATERRLAGDWSGACAAAAFDIDLDFRYVAARHGREVAADLHDDLLHLAPDLLRWHMPRCAPDGLLRPGTTVALARYGPPEYETHFAQTGSVYLVARTAPRWAEAGQRIALELWDDAMSSPHPHPRPHRRFRLDLHRHMWDTRQSNELLIRSSTTDVPTEEIDAAVPDGCAVGRWPAEAALLLRSSGGRQGLVRVQFGGGHDVVLDVSDGDPPGMTRVSDPPRHRSHGLPVLPDAATRASPDLELLRIGALTPDQLHPLVASALVPGTHNSATERAETDTRAGTEATHVRVVRCRGESHRIGLARGSLSALDHSPDELHREQLLVALTGTPVPCLQAIEQAYRRPDCLPDVRERLDFGDIDGALTIVENLLGRDARLQDGPLRDALRAVAVQQEIYADFRAGITSSPPQPNRYGRRARARRLHDTRRHRTRR